MATTLEDVKAQLDRIEGALSGIKTFKGTVGSLFKNDYGFWKLTVESGAKKVEASTKDESLVEGLNEGDKVTITYTEKQSPSKQDPSKVFTNRYLETVTPF